MGWFGPRGLASVVFTLIAVEDCTGPARSPTTSRSSPPGRSCSRSSPTGSRPDPRTRLRSSLHEGGRHPGAGREPGAADPGENGSPIETRAKPCEASSSADAWEWSNWNIVPSGRAQVCAGGARAFGRMPEGEDGRTHPDSRTELQKLLTSSAMPTVSSSSSHCPRTLEPEPGPARRRSPRCADPSRCPSRYADLALNAAGVVVELGAGMARRPTRS